MSKQEDKKWSVEDFCRRHYRVEGDDLDKAKRILVTVTLDGKKLFEMQAREPGIVAIVSKPDEQGIDFEIVEPGGARFIDHRMAEGQMSEPVAPWQIEALGI